MSESLRGKKVEAATVSHARDCVPILQLALLPAISFVFLLGLKCYPLFAAIVGPRKRGCGTDENLTKTTHLTKAT